VARQRHIQSKYDKWRAARQQKASLTEQSDKRTVAGSRAAAAANSQWMWFRRRLLRCTVLTGQSAAELAKAFGINTTNHLTSMFIAQSTQLAAANTQLASFVSSRSGVRFRPRSNCRTSAGATPPRCHEVVTTRPKLSVGAGGRSRTMADLLPQARRNLFGHPTDLLGRPWTGRTDFPS
jgi:hypothetical protein